MPTSADERRRAAFALFKNIQDVTRDATDREAKGDAIVAALDAAESELAGGTAPAAPSLGAANANVRGNRRQSPAPATGNTAATAGRVLTASGAPISSSRELGAAFGEAVRLAQRDRAGNFHRVFSAEWRYPEDRTLDATDSVGNTAKLDALLSPEALVASGGICGPVDVDFSLPVIVNEATPLADGLPSFGAKRGGLRYSTTPSLTSSNAASASTVWTEATDASPGGATKPVLTIQCGTEVEVFVDALPTRIQMGNLQARFNPELTDGIVGLAMTAAARMGELNLLSKISAGSTTVSTGGGAGLGGAREFLATVETVVAGMRYRNRIPRALPMTVALPDWLRGLVRADLVRSMAHGGEVSEEWDLTDAQLDALLSARGLQPIWLADGQAATTPGGISVPAQTFGPQAVGALNDFPRTVSYFIWPAGSWVHLDGGRIDFSVIRDSVLNSTNQFETMSETFSTVAFRGVESLEVVSTIRPNGLSAGTVNTSTY